MIANIPKLKPWKSIWLGYKFTLINFVPLIKSTSLAIASLIFYFFPYENQIPNPLLPNASYALLQPLIFAYFAVGWHRYILLGERAGTFRYGARELKCFLLLFGASILIGLTFEMFGFAKTNMAQLFMLLVAICTIIVGLIVFFFLPGLSIGHSVKSIWQSWNRFKGSHARFILMQIVSIGTGIVVFGTSVLFAGYFLRQPLMFILGKDAEIEWFAGTTISSVYITEFVIAVFHGFVATATIAATLSSVSIAYAISIGHVVQGTGESGTPKK